MTIYGSTESCAKGVENPVEGRKKPCFNGLPGEVHTDGARLQPRQGRALASLPRGRCVAEGHCEKRCLR